MTKLKIGEGIRQGDVYLFRIADGELPKGTLEKAVNGENVLAYGEASGHQHSFKATDTELYSGSEKLCALAKKYGVQEKLSVTHGLRIVVNNTSLRHGTPARGFVDLDHDTIPFSKGDYIVLRPAEYSDDDEFKAIAD